MIPLTWSWPLTQGHSAPLTGAVVVKTSIWAVFMEVEARGSLWLASEHSGRGALETPQHRDIIEGQGPCSRE